MTKKRTKFKKGTMEETKKRNETMFKKFQKLSKTGKYGKMKLYEMLADEFDISERNSVANIIYNLQKQQNNQSSI